MSDVSLPLGAIRVQDRLLLPEYHVYVRVDGGEGGPNIPSSKTGEIEELSIRFYGFCRLQLRSCPLISTGSPELGALHFESDFLSAYQLTKKIGTLSIDLISSTLSTDSVRFPKFLVVVENSMPVPGIG